MSKELEDKVLNANIKYHTALAEVYDRDQPHFLTENIMRVDAILADLATKTGGNSLLDLGCGTGFVINIAKKYFKKIVGVDITPAMLNRVDTENGQIKLYEANTNNLSFLESNSFDVCTGYSFLHHLADFEPTINEAFRCLRPGGFFYSDQDPNSHYWALIDSIKGYENLPVYIQREVRFVIDSFEESITGKNLSIEDVNMAEYHDISKGGIDVDALSNLFQKIGFTSVDFHYEWYLGQGKVIHQQPKEDAGAIEKYLREILPASRSLFKYFSVFAEK